ncbi:hypothetical protein GPX89_07745 [Nocardia sp. ET3-3]|uniref:Uncharacterized protein n=1 Tax=Nocardia terrae TaxID=2675851 RepID=A0A7K1US16_9NOCA|nr:hypothetical protein [Nocardia terrae]MVU77140.1 hypothetical protein [Nocardia terrae]
MTAAIAKVTTAPRHLLNLAWELQDRPTLLTGDAVHGSTHLIRLITELRRVGARRIVVPLCPVCHRDVALTNILDGQRVCGSCHKRARPTKLCAHCGRDRHTVARTADGKPLCQSCYRRIALLHEECTRCHEQRFIIRRRGEERLCGNCFRRPTATCGKCGRHAVCLGVAAGRPVCETCAARKWPCARCGKTLQIAARVPDGRLCHTCYEKDPLSFRACTGCGSVERLYHRELCPRCALARRLDELVHHSSAVDRTELAALHQVLFTTGSPASTLRWLAESAASRTLTDIITGACPLTHDAIDARLPRKSSRHLRAILVSAGLLAPRDEHLANLQAWIDKTLAAVDNPERRNLLRRFVTWHHLARLRRKLRGEFAEHNQVDAIRVSLRAAITFLGWLDQQNQTLATCRQADIDRWIADGPSTHYRIRDFVHWSVAKRYAHPLQVPKYQQASQTNPLDAERRWALARQLLDDHTIAAKDRVAGLFTLLYAQPATNIVRLTAADITISSTDTYIRFGTVPLKLPEPVAVLLDEHLRTRTCRTVFGRSDESTWLFPSGTDPARPMSPGHLGRRLSRIGIQSRPGRQAALLDIATQLPAAVIADLLGISTSAADGWVDRSGASWANYAALVHRRTTH